MFFFGLYIICLALFDSFARFIGIGTFFFTERENGLCRIILPVAQAP